MAAKSGLMSCLGMRNMYIISALNNLRSQCPYCSPASPIRFTSGSSPRHHLARRVVDAHRPHPQHVAAVPEPTTKGRCSNTTRRAIELPAGRLALVPPGLKFKAHLEGPVHLFFIHFEVIGWPTAAVHSLFPEPITLQDDEFRDKLAEAALLRGQAERPPGTRSFLPS